MNPSWNRRYRIAFLVALVPPTRCLSNKTRNVFFLIFLQIYREVLHPLHHEEAESSSEAQDDHQQELPLQQEVTAVEERHCRKNRLTNDKR